jgi:hypothetical protein
MIILKDIFKEIIREGADEIGVAYFWDSETCYCEHIDQRSG